MKYENMPWETFRMFATVSIIFGGILGLNFAMLESQWLFKPPGPGGLLGIYHSFLPFIIGIVVLGYLFLIIIMCFSPEEWE